MCFLRDSSQIARPTGRAGPSRLRKRGQFFFLHRRGVKGWVDAHRARGCERYARGAAYRVTPFNGYRFASAKSRKRSLWKAHGRSSVVLATLGNPFDRVIDIQADERHVRNAFVISNRDSASKLSPQRRSAARSTFRGRARPPPPRHFRREPCDFAGAKGGDLLQIRGRLNFLPEKCT